MKILLWGGLVTGVYVLQRFVLFFFFWLAGFCWALLLNGLGVFDACFLVVVCRLDRLVGNFSSSLFFFFWQSLVYEVLKDKVSKR